VVETVRRMWQEPLEIMAAIGHGRSYGQDSQVLGRKISGIFPCALWKTLQGRSPLPTAALVTDVGNDLGYGVPVSRIVSWVEACLDELERAAATTIVTELPLESLRRLGARRFLFFRRLFFPSSTLELTALVEQAGELNERLVAIARQRKFSVIPVSGAWYGVDPIHLRRSIRRRAWPAILAAWHVDVRLPTAPRASYWLRTYLRCLAPSEQTIFGWRRHSEQPCGVLRDGTTISLY